MASNKQASGTFFERKSWILFIVVSAIFLLSGIGDVIRGMDADPAIAESFIGVPWEQLKATEPEVANLIDLNVRSGGAQIIVLSIFSIVITLKAFRPGKQWGWYAMWIWPIWMATIFFVLLLAPRQPDFAPPPPMLSAPVFFVFTVLAQVLSYRKFFPKARLEPALEKGAIA